MSVDDFLGKIKRLNNELEQINRDLDEIAARDNAEIEAYFKAAMEALPEGETKNTLRNLQRKYLEGLGPDEES